MEAEEVVDGIYYLGDLGDPPVISGYLVEAQGGVALVEAGPSNLVGAYLDAAARRVDRSRMRCALISHVHVDHGGGAWRMAEELPGFRACVYSRGARHLVDPSRLVEASRATLGWIYELWGEVRPLPASSILSVEDGGEVDLGGMKAKLMATPGHASHSSIWYLEEARALFPGDSLGMLFRTKEGDVLWPAAPPPFDYGLAMDSMRRIGQLGADCVCFPHLGFMRGSSEIVERAMATYNEFHEEAIAVSSEGGGAAELLARVSRRLPIGDLLRSQYMRDFLEMNLKGLLPTHRRNS